jgi:hypothetical protein
LAITDYEIDIITELATQEDIPEPTYEEINTAVYNQDKLSLSVY